MRSFPNCDASRSSAGVLFRDCAPAFFQSRHRSSRFSPQCVQNPSQNWSKPSQDLPKSSRNPPKSFAKSTQNRSRSLLGAHFGLMLYKSLILNAPEMAKKRPRATKRRPRASQPPTKWSPRLSQIHFLSIFFNLIFPYEICLDFWWIFA